MSNTVELAIRDNDKSGIWGGTKLSTPPAYKVIDLQNALSAVGAYTSAIDGDFGGRTQKSLKIFQWVCANLTSCIKNGSLSSFSKSTSIKVNGRLDQFTQVELEKWVADKQSVTGDLVRVSFSALSNTEASSGFKKTSSPKVITGEVVVSKGAVSLLKKINTEAKNKGVTIKINQTFREHGVKVTGAVVSPASKSQHLLGHAIDCNIVDGSNWNNSSAFKQKKQTQNAKDIIAALKSAGNRWGGDFVKTDTPHFDKQ